MTKFLTIGMATAALLGSTAALANHHAGGEPRGDVTRAAALTQSAERFAKMDVNGDGQLSAADREAKRAKRFAKTDTDGNGELSPAEMTAAREAHKAERDQRRAEHGERRAEAGERRGGDRQRGQRGGGRGEMRAEMMQRADTDQSGTISQTEFTAAALARFDAADANSDGTVTADEHEAQRGERRGKMRERMQERRSQG